MEAVMAVWVLPRRSSTSALRLERTESPTRRAPASVATLTATPPIMASWVGQ